MVMNKFELAIHAGAEKEWSKLDGSIKRRFKEKLDNERLINPRVAKDALRELPDCYKIKITTPQYRLIYHVNDATRLLTILSVATREDVYEELRIRLEKEQLKTRLIMQVHDELVLEVPDSELALVKEKLPGLMCHVAELKVPLEVGLGVGANWEAAH